MKKLTTDFHDKYQEYSSYLIKKEVGGWTRGGSICCGGRCVGRSHAPGGEGYFPTKVAAVLFVPSYGQICTL